MPFRCEAKVYTTIRPAPCFLTERARPRKCQQPPLSGDASTTATTRPTLPTAKVEMHNEDFPLGQMAKKHFDVWSEGISPWSGTRPQPQHGSQRSRPPAPPTSIIRAIQVGGISKKQKNNLKQYYSIPKLHSAIYQFMRPIPAHAIQPWPLQSNPTASIQPHPSNPIQSNAIRFNPIRCNQIQSDPSNPGRHPIHPIHPSIYPNRIQIKSSRQNNQATDQPTKQPIKPIKQIKQSTDQSNQTINHQIKSFQTNTTISQSIKKSSNQSIQSINSMKSNQVKSSQVK